MAGVSEQCVEHKIASGELHLASGGVTVHELIKVFPNLAPLSGVKLKTVKSTPNGNAKQRADQTVPADSATVDVLVRELEWNKALLEQTNRQMARQLDEQRALIADQARRLDEKDRFWARQIEIAQSLLPAPAVEPPPRKRFLGLF